MTQNAWLIASKRLRNLCSLAASACRVKCAFVTSVVVWETQSSVPS